MGILASPFKSNLSLMSGNFPPVAQNGGREDKWDPKPSEEEPEVQKALQSISLRDPLRTLFIKRENDRRDLLPNTNKISWKTKDELTVSNRELNILNNPLRLVEHYQDLIKHHVATRIALFFQQAVVCYDTPFHYEIAETEGQFFEAPTLKVKSEAGSKAQIKFQAAHHSTIPGLKACLKSEYDQSLVIGAQPRYFAFLKRSHLENLDNSTGGMPDFVNKIDTLIDGKSKSKKELRGAAINLINQVAQTRLNPIEATRRFLNDFNHELLTRPLISKTITPEKRQVIEMYLEQVNQSIALASAPEDINGTHPFFDHLLNVNVSQENAADIPIIRNIVYKRKYEIIREAQFVESKIQQLIDTNFPHPRQDDKHSVRLALTYAARFDIPLKTTLEKLFCISLPVIEQNPTLCATLENQYNASQRLYANVLREIRMIVRDFQKLEQSFQAMLLRDFRITLRNYKQKQLSDKVIEVIARKILAENNKPIPDLAKIRFLNSIPTSPSTISRLENSRIHIVKAFKTPESQRRKILTLEYAKILSKALEIQPGHFFCSFFASKDS